MTPAIGAHPDYAFVGDAAANPALTVFGCQRRTVGNAACYGPDQIQTAYSIKPLYAAGFAGAGRTIVIVDAFQSPTITQDLALFDSAFNLPAPAFNIIAPDGLTPFNPADANMVGWSAEISLDVQWAHAIAPMAAIDLVLAKSNQDADILSATKYAVDNNLGDVLSQSFGEAEQCMSPDLLAAQHAVFDQALAKGWTLFASSGDQGSALPTCDGTGFFQAASTPASDPDVTGVGGTQLHATPVVVSGSPPAITDPGGVYQSENVWNDGANGVSGDAGGGGFSVVFPRPVYQAAVVNEAGRAVPDVAYNAAVDGGVVAFWGVPFGPGAAFRFGGTSAGSPQWAGLLAIADQMAGARQGNINKTLYILGKGRQERYFHDVTVGNNAFVVDQNTTIPGFAATPGFDEASGWGSPIASALVPAIVKPGNG